jgi:hypothetical protein
MDFPDTYQQNQEKQCSFHISTPVLLAGESAYQWLLFPSVIQLSIGNFSKLAMSLLFFMRLPCQTDGSGSANCNFMHHERISKGTYAQNFLVFGAKNEHFSDRLTKSFLYALRFAARAPTA